MFSVNRLPSPAVFSLPGGASRWFERLSPIQTATAVSAFHCFPCSSVLDQLRRPQTRNNVPRESIGRVKDVNYSLKATQSRRFSAQSLLSGRLGRPLSRSAGSLCPPGPYGRVSVPAPHSCLTSCMGTLVSAGWVHVALSRTR